MIIIVIIIVVISVSIMMIMKTVIIMVSSLKRHSQQSHGLDDFTPVGVDGIGFCIRPRGWGIPLALPGRHSYKNIGFRILLLIISGYVVLSVLISNGKYT